MQWFLIFSVSGTPIKDFSLKAPCLHQCRCILKKQHKTVNPQIFHWEAMGVRGDLVENHCFGESGIKRATMLFDMQ